MGVEIRRILFATDLSESSRHAFAYASSLADRLPARLVLFHVLGRSPRGFEDRLDSLAGEGATARFRNLRREHATEVLMGKKRDDHMIRRALCDFYGSGSAPSDIPFDSFEVMIREGEVGENIANAAAELRCDLIVLGSHATLSSGATVGATADAVLKRSSVPVFVAPPLRHGSPEAAPSGR